MTHVRNYIQWTVNILKYKYLTINFFLTQSNSRFQNSYRENLEFGMCYSALVHIYTFKTALGNHIPSFFFKIIHFLVSLFHRLMLGLFNCFMLMLIFAR